VRHLRPSAIGAPGDNLGIDRNPVIIVKPSYDLIRDLGAEL
jgi:hypothetical protein